MTQWKSFLVVTLFLVGLMPTATSQAVVAYSISFTDGQVNLDVGPGSYYSMVESNEESRFEFSANLKDNETITYTNNTDVENNQRILYLTIHVWWSIENWTYTHNFSMNAFGLSNSSSERSDSMELTWYVNENLTGGNFALGMAENESDFESSFFRTAPPLSMSFDFTDGNALNFSEVSFEVTTRIVTWEFTDIGIGGIGCTEMIISNEGQGSIDVDVSITGGGVTISPAAVSVTLGSGGSITVPVCVLALPQSSYKNVQVTAIAQGRESNSQLNQVNKNAGFAAIINQYARLSVHATQATVDICLGQGSFVTFVVVNLGNYQDTIAVEILNQTDLEDAGFEVALAAVQYLVDSQGEQPVQILVNASEKHNDFELIFRASTTLQGETAASSNSTILNVIDCEAEETIDDSGSIIELPSLSLLAVVAMLGIVSILRRR